MKRRGRLPVAYPLAAAGTARPSLPISVFAEDFSLLIRTPRRLVVRRNVVRVLS